MFSEDPEPLPLFKWIAHPSLLFDGKTIDLDTEELPGADMLSNLEHFTMYTSFMLDKAPGGKELTIVSHSSCNCWALMLDADGELVFGSRCTTSIIKTGFNMPLE